MKKSMVLLVLFLMLGGQSATATMYTDIYNYKNDRAPTWHWSYEWLYLWGVGSEWHWTHDITGEGFNLASEEVLSVELLLHLSDERYIFGANYDEPESVSVWADSAFLGTIDIELPTMYTLPIDNSLIENDGRLNILLYVPTGDFLFDQARLLVETQPIPEPSSIILICLGLIILVGLKTVQSWRNSPTGRSGVPCLFPTV